MELELQDIRPTVVLHVTIRNRSEKAVNRNEGDSYESATSSGQVASAIPVELEMGWPGASVAAKKHVLLVLKWQLSLDRPKENQGCLSAWISGGLSVGVSGLK